MKAMPMSEATEAHAILERGENRGKVVRDNYRRWLDLRFDLPIAGDACRVVWVRPWGETTEQRVFSFEVY